MINKGRNNTFFFKKKKAFFDRSVDEMSFSFFKASRPKTPQEVVKTIKDSLMALDTKTVVEVKALEKVSSLSTFIYLFIYFMITGLLFDDQLQINFSLFY